MACRVGRVARATGTGVGRRIGRAIGIEGWNAETVVEIKTEVDESMAEWLVILKAADFGLSSQDVGMTFGKFGQCSQAYVLNLRFLHCQLQWGHCIRAASSHSSKGR